eukprot:COSAG02_NODE_1592_length_11779_cov_5.589640_1_plen_75_part_00
MPTTPATPAKTATFNRKQYSKQYYEDNKEKILEYQRQYYRKNRKPKPKPHFEIIHKKVTLFADNPKCYVAVRRL